MSNPFSDEQQWVLLMAEKMFDERVWHDEEDRLVAAIALRMRFTGGVPTDPASLRHHSSRTGSCIDPLRAQTLARAKGLAPIDPISGQSPRRSVKANPEWQVGLAPAYDYDLAGAKVS